MIDFEKLCDSCIAFLVESSAEDVNRFHELHKEPEFEKLKGTEFDAFLAGLFAVSKVDAIFRNLPDVPSDN